MAFGPGVLRDVNKGNEKNQVVKKIMVFIFLKMNSSLFEDGYVFNKAYFLS